MTLCITVTLVFKLPCDRLSIDFETLNDSLKHDNNMNVHVLNHVTPSTLSQNKHRKYYPDRARRETDRV